MARRLVISGRLGADEPVKLEMECFGKQVTPTTFTAALALPTVEPIIANNTKIFIDTTWAGLGGTQKTDLLREFSIEIMSGLHPKFHGGAKTMTAHGEGYFDIMGTFTFEGNANADTLFDAFQAETPYAIRLSNDGSQIGAGTNHSLSIDMWGSFEEVIPLGSESEGNNLHTAIFHGYYDTTGSAMFDVDVTTDQNTI
jgi:ribosomal protein L31